MAVTLYRQIGKGKARRYQKVNLGRGRRPGDLTGPYFLRYSHADGSRPWEHVGDDLDSAIDAQKRKQAFFEALDANVPVIQSQDETGRTKITDAVYQWFAELQLFQGKDQQGKSEKTLRAYNYRLGFFLDFTAQQNVRFLDQIDRNQLLRYVKFLREHDSDLDDRTVHNIFETLNTFLRTRDILTYCRQDSGGTRLCREAAEALHEAGTSSDVCGDGRRTEVALWSLPEFWRSGCRDAEH